MKLISVIVPIYKVEKYLEKCVASIVGQTYQNLEIILIDDGSLDNCPRICDAWAEKDNRIQVIHKENGGLSDARNAGLEVATGEYISFVDSDDWIEPTFLEVLYQTMRQQKADIVSCGVSYVNEQGTCIGQKICSQPMITLSKVEALKQLVIEQEVAQTVWNKLYKKSVLEEILFEVGRHHEDDFWTYRVFDRAVKVVVIQDALYNYLQRSSSIMGTGYTLRRMDGLEARFLRMEFLQKYEELALFARVRILYDCMYQFQAALKYLKLDEQNTVTRFIAAKLKELPGFKEYGDIVPFKYKIWFSLFRKYPFAISRLRNRLRIGV